LHDFSDKGRLAASRETGQQDIGSCGLIVHIVKSA
jgi:hypothetical protein